MTTTPAGTALRERATHLPGAVKLAMGLDDRELVELRRMLRTLMASVAATTRG